MALDASTVTTQLTNFFDAIANIRDIPFIEATLPIALPGSTPGIIPEPVKYYLTIDGIDGGSNAARHVGASPTSATRRETV